MGAITINGNYTSTGTNAYVGFFIDIDAAAPAGGTPGTTHDLLTINGDITGTNATMFSLASFNSAAVGAPTTGNGIQVIRVTGASSASNFYQGSAMSAGPYQYLLHHVPNFSGTDDGFFLRSAVRDELIAHAALLSAGQELVRSCYNDGQRIPDSPKSATYGRAWVGYRQGSTDFGADTGIDSNVDFSCTTGGMDWRMGNGWFGGVSGGFGDTEGNILTPAGEARFTGTGRTAEVFASFTSEALFINLSAGYNAMDYTYDGNLLFPILAETAGLIGRAETGVAIDLDAIAVKLIGAVSYDGTSCDNTCLGVAASEESGLLEAKGTVRIDGVAHGGSVRPWISASFSDVLSDGINTVSLSGVTVSHDTNGQRLSLDAGLKAYLDQNFALYLDGGYQESLTTDVTGYKAGIGLKMYW
jgi:outer membrane autotransporter protein